MSARSAWVLAILTGLLAMAPPAHALQIDSTFTEGHGPPDDSKPDSYEFVNDSPSEANIVQLVLDLGTSASGAFFDPADSPFTVVVAGGVGFDGNFNLVGNQFLTLNFTDFQPARRSSSQWTPTTRTVAARWAPTSRARRSTPRIRA